MLDDAARARRPLAATICYNFARVVVCVCVLFTAAARLYHTATVRCRGVAANGEDAKSRSEITAQTHAFNPDALISVYLKAQTIVGICWPGTQTHAEKTDTIFRLTQRRRFVVAPPSSLFALRVQLVLADRAAGPRACSSTQLEMRAT